MADQQPPLPEAAARPPPRNNNNNNNDHLPLQQEEQPAQFNFPVKKLLLTACLGGVALLLGAVIAVVQLRINQAHQLLLRKSQDPLMMASSSSSSSSSSSTKFKDGAASTHVPSHPSTTDQYAFHAQPPALPATGSGRMAAAHAYWNQFQGIAPGSEEDVSWHPLAYHHQERGPSSSVFGDEDYDYDVTDKDKEDKSSSSSSSSDNSEEEQQQRQQQKQQQRADAKFFALQQAAQLGHPQAQYVYANALASGVLPLQHNRQFHNHNHLQDYQNHYHHLEVADDFLHAHTKQQQEAWLYWHMAAQSGHIEAAMALAHRYETLWEKETASLKTKSGSKHSKENNDKKSKSSQHQQQPAEPSFTCSDVLPYYQAAAHGIMDQLEVHPHSRAKVLPPTEKHLLYQVHLHGGTSSQLDWHNKPDESLDAIQFYHFKATRAVDPDANAAMTLATLYHYGYRGVAQNLTLALQYYDVAAQAGSWEAAGVAGWFHIFGLGMHGHERDLFQALKYFRMGILPGGLEGCQARYARKKKFKQQQQLKTQKQQQSQESQEEQEALMVQCEPNCLNGMGLLQVFGVPMSVDVDLDEAIEYFTLAKDMGHGDAAYNLAMVTLGWKSNYIPLDEAMAKHAKDQEQREKLENDEEFVMEGNSVKDKYGVTHLQYPEFMEDPVTMKAGPSQLDMQHAVQYLMIAVQKGHLQARHRLALLYDTGVLSSPDAGSTGISTRRGRSKSGSSTEILPQDCEKALKHYKWITEQASLDVLHRLRRAYKDYIAGDLESSLIQYMGIAELGNERAQVNAAFLLEQGTCLGLSHTDCHKASVRYWKAAAAVGNAEACLRVGDFYYYGKLRPPQDPIASMWDRPFGWSQYLIFPERHLPSLMKTVSEQVLDLVQSYLEPPESDDVKPTLSENSDEHVIADTGDSTEGGTCTATDEAAGTCAANLVGEAANGGTAARREEDERDLKMAAHYYRIAAENHASPRANFNLAFLHEWGLGLTQDFPLAKRHYDLAASAVAASREADLAVQIALWTLALHEHVVRIKMLWEDYWAIGEGEEGETGAHSNILEAVPRVITNIIAGKPVPGGPIESNDGDAPFGHDRRVRKTKMDIIMAHLWTWESLLILFLTIVLWILLQRRRQRTRR